MLLRKNAYATCVLGKIEKPDPPLAHPWIAPGGEKNPLKLSLNGAFSSYLCLLLEVVL
jgi:hypothetical protein